MPDVSSGGDRVREVPGVGEQYRRNEDAVRALGLGGRAGGGARAEAALREGSALQHGARELRDDGACERPWLRVARQGLGVPGSFRRMRLQAARVHVRGVLVSKRDEVSHAAVCVVTCPFYGCYHKCPRSQMAAHQVDAAGEHAMISARKICSLETTQVALMRSVQLLKEQARMTPVDIDFSIDASTAFAVPETWKTIIDSPPVMVRQGSAVMAPFRLILGFRWIVSAADARAAGASPYGIYLAVLNQDAKPAVFRGKLCICDRLRDQPYNALTLGGRNMISGRDRNQEIRYGQMYGQKLTLSAANKEQITQEYGMIRFIGKFYVDVPSVSKWLEL